MGVYLDKYTCYAMDVSEEIFNIIKNDYDKWEYIHDTLVLDDNPIPDNLKLLGLKTRYDKEPLKKGDAELIYDGMSGNYAYLIIIEDVDRWSDDYSQPSEVVQRALWKTEVSKDIKDRLEQIYRIVFEKDAKNDVHLMMINHYH